MAQTTRRRRPATKLQAVRPVSVADLLDDVAVFYQHFSFTPDPDTTARVAVEEFREFLQAADEYATIARMRNSLIEAGFFEAATHFEPTEAAARQRFLGEAADAFYVINGHLYAFDVTPQEWEQAVKECRAKNRAKRYPDWQLIDGKIRRAS